VNHAWHLLMRSGGSDPISEIARHVGWSHKHLITKFKQQNRGDPQSAAQLLRPSTVWRHLNDEHSWDRIAAECGYADQAHRTHEFRRFTGTTPGARRWCGRLFDRAHRAQANVHFVAPDSGGPEPTPTA
jgi:AraC-like DNA-binding protein